VNSSRFLGAGVVLLIGVCIYLLSPRYWKEYSDDGTPGLLRAIWAVVRVQEALLYFVVLGIAVAYLVMGNEGGRLVGAALLVSLVLVGVRFARRRRAWLSRER
jgi:hypothetical protein